jgi:putative Holliday junction resolvase
MKYLGIDYGKKKAGLAFSEGKLAEPLVVLRFENKEELLKKLNEVIKKEKPEKIVVGVSEGEMGEESRQFAKKINAETFDETLTSQDANTFAIESGISRKKRKNMEDAFAATIMLQNYLDSSNIN